MVLSMTGFGRGESSNSGYSVTVEIRSLNSRYLDISSRLPQKLQDKELELKELVQEHISRGKLNINVHLSTAGSGEPEVALDIPKVKGYTRLLKELKETAGIESPLTLQHLMQFNDIFISREEDEDVLNKQWEMIKEATLDALNALIKMRTQEGDQLKNDLLQRIHTIDSSMEIIEQASGGRFDEVRTKLKDRIQSLIDEDKIDEDRLEFEIAVLADKMDITEEIVRLRSHLKFFNEAVEQPEPAGRRLNFLTQEINRELNTIGSKANDSDIAQYVVKSKEALEQIREQVQNVE